VAFILTGDESGKPVNGKVLGFNGETYDIELIKGEAPIQVAPKEVLKRVFLGYFKDEDMPVVRGDIVTIKKGTVVKTVGREPKPAGKTYHVKVHHLLPGCAQWGREPAHNPKVCWAGPGGYWSEVELNDVPEAQPRES
jgi:hypothetical protein